MGNLTLELNINSASNLANVNLMTKMDVCAVVTIHGDYTQMKQKVKTAVDRSGGSNPTWNHTVKFSFNERLARDGRSTVVMRLVSRRRVLGNKDIGGVKIPLLELLNSITPPINGDGNGKEMTFVTYQVKSPSGKRKGCLNFSYRFNTPPVNPDVPAIVNRTVSLPAVANPPPSQVEHSRSAPPESTTKYRQLSLPSYQKDSGNQKHQNAGRSMFDPLPISYGAGSSPYDKSGYAYQHAPPLQSYIAPPTLSHQGYVPYGYLPPGYGYGYGSTQPSKGIGLGLGLGLGAGLLGGLMMGDIVSDVANCYDL